MPYLKNFQERLGSFLRNPTAGLSLAVGLVANTVLWAMLGLRLGTWPAQIPLHYTIYFGIDLLGGIPLDPKVCQASEDGKPIVLAHPDSAPAKALREVARKVAAQVSIRNATSKPLEIKLVKA